MKAWTCRDKRQGFTPTVRALHRGPQNIPNLPHIKMHGDTVRRTKHLELSHDTQFIQNLLHAEQPEPFLTAQAESSPPRNQNQEPAFTGQLESGTIRNLPAAQPETSRP